MQFSLICHLQDNNKIVLKEMLQNNKLQSCSRKNIELLVKLTCVVSHISRYRHLAGKLVRLMASKSTPKKLYKKSSASNEDSARC